MKQGETAPDRFPGSAREGERKRVLVMPGGLWQVPVVRLAQQMGCFVICADGTANPPCWEVADEFVQVELQNIDALVELGRKWHIDAVLTDQTDFAVPLVAQVARRLGLRGLPVEVANAATNKGLMRQRAAEGNVVQPRFRVCQTVADVRAAIAELGLPLFCKPVDSQSSRGVCVLKTADETDIKAALARCLDATKTRQAIVEQYIQGTECTAEAFVVGGKATLLAISDKTHYADLPGVARTLTYPAAFAGDVMARIEEANARVIGALGIPFGITHAEYLVDDRGQPWLVEIAARGGGTRITTHIVPAVSGFEPVPALLRVLLGRDVIIPPRKNRGAQLRFLRLPPGRVQRFVNLDELQKRPGIIEIMFNVAPGDVIRPVEDDRSRHGFVIAEGESREEAEARAAAVEKDLQIDFEPVG